MMVAEAGLKGKRTMLVLNGWVITIIGNTLTIVLDWPLLLIISGVGMWLILWGCYLWVKLKKRHPAFMLFGLLAPIGYLPLAMLKEGDHA